MDDKKRDSTIELTPHVDEVHKANDETSDEAILMLSGDGEARRAFLKRALLLGGGIAGVNLLTAYESQRVEVFVCQGV